MPQTNIDMEKIWLEFDNKHTVELKHKLMLGYVWLVKYVLQQMSLPIGSILTDEDYFNIGILGLHEAIERFETGRGVKFESYAIPRIKGMVQDELRRLDWLSRTARKKASEFMQAGDSLRSEMGRDVSPEEIIKQLNISPEQYNTYLAAAAAARASMSLSESHTYFSEDEEVDILQETSDESQISPLSAMENEERLTFLTSYIQSLSERKRVVISLYYYEELTFKEIGQVLNVSESRVSQIHTQVINELRKRLDEFDNA